MKEISEIKHEISMMIEFASKGNSDMVKYEQKRIFSYLDEIEARLADTKRALRILGNSFSVPEVFGEFGDKVIKYVHDDLELEDVYTLDELREYIADATEAGL